MDFPKKQAQRLMPLYLLEYNEKLFEYHPDPSASWGGGSGGSYTGGDGINISSDNVISVDNTVAKKSDIPTNYVTTDTNQTITGAKQINTQFTFGDDNNNNGIVINANYVNRPLIAMYNDTLEGELSIGVDDGTETSITGPYFSYEDNNGLRQYKLPHQDATGGNTYTLATTSDLPTKTSDLTNDSGFITSSALTSYVTTTQLEDALDDYALSTDIPTEVSQLTNDAGYTTQTWVQNQGYSTFSGDYNDLTNKPTIPVVPTNISSFTNDVGYITGITSSMVTTALGYTPGTSNFSGDYNDLTNKPTIPTNYVTTDTIQTINVTKNFGSGTLVVKDSVDMLQHYTHMFRYVEGTGVIDFELPTSKPKGNVQVPTKYTLATTDDIPSLTGYATEQWVTNQGYSTFSGSYNDLTDKPTIPTDYVTLDTNQSITGNKYFDSGHLIVKRSSPFNMSLAFTPNKFYYVVGNNSTNFNLPTGKPSGTIDEPTEYTLATTDDIPTTATSTSTVTPTTETLVFTLSDDSTVTVNVMTGATVSTTTTLS